MWKRLALLTLAISVVLLGLFAAGWLKNPVSLLRTENRVAYKHIVQLKAKLAANPDDHFAWNELGFYYRQLKQYPEALDAHARAIALFPYHVDFRLYRSDTLATAQRYDESLADLESLEARGYVRSDRPNELFERKVNILHAKRDFLAAERYILSSFDSRDPLHWELLGATRLQQGKRQQALNDYEAGLRIDPARISLQLKLAGLRKGGDR